MRENTGEVMVDLLNHKGYFLHQRIVSSTDTFPP
jgi:hypothetical protein